MDRASFRLHLAVDVREVFGYYGSEGQKDNNNHTTATGGYG